MSSYKAEVMGDNFGGDVNLPANIPKDEDKGGNSPIIPDTKITWDWSKGLGLFMDFGKWKENFPLQLSLTGIKIKLPWSDDFKDASDLKVTNLLFWALLIGGSIFVVKKVL